MLRSIENFGLAMASLFVGVVSLCGLLFIGGALVGVAFLILD